MVEAIKGFRLETVDEMKSALKAADSPSTIIVYPDTPHAFFADYRASYRQGAAEDGWNRLLGVVQEVRSRLSHTAPIARLSATSFNPVPLVGIHLQAPLSNYALTRV